MVIDKREAFTWVSGSDFDYVDFFSNQINEWIKLDIYEKQLLSNFCIWSMACHSAKGLIYVLIIQISK